MNIKEISNVLSTLPSQSPKPQTDLSKDFATILLNEMLKSADVFKEEGGLNYTGMFRFQMAQKLSEAISKKIDLKGGLEELKGIADKIADREGVSRKLVRSVIQCESGWNKDAVSPKGAKGLMQLIDATADRFGVTSSFNPVENIEGGVKYLSKLLKEFEGDLEKVIAAYNAGEGAVRKYGGIPPYKETQEYVKKVLEQMNTKKV